MLRRIHDVLSREEIAELTQPSDWRGAWSVCVSYAIVAGALWLAAAWPHPLSAVVAVVLLGGRQLGLAVLMHECAHRSLFRSRWLNEWVGRWLCAAPVWNRLEDYRQHHLPHHAYTGTERDPDLGLVTPFPVSRGSLARKLLRDLIGLSGIKRVVAMLAMDAGILSYTASTNAVRLDQRGRSAGAVLAGLARFTGPMLVFHAAMYLLLDALGHGWLMWLWIAAQLTTFSLFVRIRAMAEHACTAATADPWRNTRTTRASWLARLTVAPHHVNHHLEHHLLMTVPHYRLPAMHQLLRDRGVLEGAHLAPSYLAVLRAMTATASAL